MTYQIFQLPKATLIGSASIKPSWKVSFFLTGTTTPAPVYTTSALSTTHTQPVQADSGGTLATIYLDPAIVYKASVYDQNDVLQYTVDPVNDSLLSAAVIGGYLYPRTAAEISASVTPTNYAYPELNVRRYGAVFDGSTDDTTAIQNALNVAQQINGVVRLPPGTAIFTNLTMYAYTTLQGDGMGQTILKRKAASTGTALRERTAAEGNASGASGLWVRDLQIDGDGTAGDGINLGNQVPGAQLNFLSGVSNVHTRNFPSGTGMILNQNAARCGYLWSNLCATGISVSGGSNFYESIWVEANTTDGLVAGGSADTFAFVHGEQQATDIPYVRVTGSQNRFLTVTVTLARNTTKIIQLDVGANRNAFFNCFADQQGTYTITDFIYSQTWSSGTGANYLVPFYLNQEGQASYFFNGSTNQRTDMVGAALKMGAYLSEKYSPVTYSASMTIDASLGNYYSIDANNGSAFTINAPTNPTTGQQITVRLRNTSGGALGAATWNAVFKMQSWTNPGVGGNRSIVFRYDGTNWTEIAKTSGDVPN